MVPGCWEGHSPSLFTRRRVAAENAKPSIRCAGSDQQGERRQGSLSSMSSRNTRRD